MTEGERRGRRFERPATPTQLLDALPRRRPSAGRGRAALLRSIRSKFTSEREEGAAGLLSPLSYNLSDSAFQNEQV